MNRYYVGFIFGVLAYGSILALELIVFKSCFTFMGAIITVVMFMNETKYK